MIGSKFYTGNQNEWLKLLSARSSDRRRLQPALRNAAVMRFSCILCMLLWWTRMPACHWRLSLCRINDSLELVVRPVSVENLGLFCAVLSHDKCGVLEGYRCVGRMPCLCGFRIEAFRLEDGSSIFLRILSIYMARILSGLYSWSFAMDRLIASHLAGRWAANTRSVAKIFVCGNSWRSSGNATAKSRVSACYIY